MRVTAVAVPLFAILALAQPHKRQQHQHAAKHHEARNAEPVIEWVTEYEYTTTIVPVTQTIWVSPGFVPPTETPSTEYRNTVPAQLYELPQESSTSTPSTTSTSEAPSSPSPPPPPPPPPTPATTSVEATTVAPPPPPPPAQSTEEKAAEQPTQMTSEALVQPAPVPSSVAPVEAPPSKAPEPVTQPSQQTQAPTLVAEPVATTQAPASSNSESSSGGSSTGECSSGNACKGDMTHYTAGMGACGWENNGDQDSVVALSHLLMGTQSNGNPYCGKSITVKLNGKSVTAKVVDKCMGCEVHAIDLSNIAFESLEDMGVGRTQVEWYFN